MSTHLDIVLFNMLKTLSNAFSMRTTHSEGEWVRKVYHNNEVLLIARSTEKKDVNQTEADPQLTHVVSLARLQYKDDNAVALGLLADYLAAFMPATDFVVERDSIFFTVHCLDRGGIIEEHVIELPNISHFTGKDATELYATLTNQSRVLNTIDTAPLLHGSQHNDTIDMFRSLLFYALLGGYTATTASKCSLEYRDPKLTFKLDDGLLEYGVGRAPVRQANKGMSYTDNHNYTRFVNAFMKNRISFKFRTIAIFEDSDRCTIITDRGWYSYKPC